MFSPVPTVIQNTLKISLDVHLKKKHCNKINRKIVMENDIVEEECIDNEIGEDDDIGDGEYSYTKEFDQSIISQ